ncbi:hypothetical protein [Leifsonia sp. Leaf264]|uniref:hypothetical protein n=1 Tax=Leifsonia sp. Leaf264 TaxID=1736314 RepID=UPI0006FFBE55|nr:hypothetical protein [Leifsonia sp. Leaf264]KQO98596.1 hypothetical protein ASF30_11075 [Leifsonia sp. Leaf264]
MTLLNYDAAARAAWKAIHPEGDWDSIPSDEHTNWMSLVGDAARRAETATTRQRSGEPDHIYRAGVLGDTERAAIDRGYRNRTEVRTPITVNEYDFAVKWDDERTFPFFEDEQAIGIFGYGHTDKQAFAAAVNDYDVYVGNVDPGEATYDASVVEHDWAVAYTVNGDVNSWLLSTHDVTETTKGAFPVTVVPR